ncbi:MAG TPA: TetR/AcrR family transcriptional regulator [Acidimicrobiales bacterium]|nr:TetR/AcrR family transcriptional regulator [Acidimicrobiales bacterium]
MRPLPEHMEHKLMAVADLFADRGLDATKMEDVAAATGIPKATLYYYFTGKEEILSFLFQQVLSAVHLAVTTAAAGPGPAAGRLRRVIDAHLQVFADYPMASRALQFDLGRAARLPEVARSVEASFIGPVTDLLREGGRDGSLAPIDHPRLVAVALLGAVTTTGLNGISPERPDPVGELADLLSHVFLDGLVARGAA